ncbi:MAG: alanine--tRNA ligase [Alphaproteobacteria bacterium]|jgi:alanyl-tRNA synthetase|nr:alanine--tRNA ligase [Alphaproteobacteria bacterium]
MKSVNDIRSEFLNFFKGKGHEIVPSSPLVPQNDPTLMFANSGMVQFKNVFTGVEKRPYTRATTAQKCVRAGGKHNDLDNVGYTARHHTFFEMMGNFSFGDYFKEDAIAFAWELVTKNFGMNPDKLLVTVHSSDEEAAAIWKKVSGFSDSKIIRIPTNDNFWMMGDYGPCGPCSEIFYDQGDKLQGGPPGSPDQDGDRFLEFWNNVFMQFEQEPDGNGGHNRKPLPKPSIDTGLGLERTAALMQGKSSNYDIDLLRNIIEHSADLTGISPDGKEAPSHRVIADHLRCSSFLLADGVMPSNEGRGYVLRRIMRRGMRHAHLLGAKEPLMYRLFPTLLTMMGAAYPELKRAESLITETLKQEETRFKTTLERGLKLLDEETRNLSKGGTLAGDVAFKLYDTYGFPLDLTQDALKAKGIAVDTAGFEKSMEKQKAEARKSWAGSGDAGTEKLWFEILEEAGPTEFLGYENEIAEGQIKAIVKDGKKVQSLKSGEEGIVIVNQTPFYAESGGQVGDTGFLVSAASADGKQASATVQITDTKKQVGALWLHIVKMGQGEIKVGQGVELKVDNARRSAIRANHSATHLLHEALRQVLGDHVAQKGSLQDAGRTRFDISHPKAITKEELERVEKIVNDEIKANTDVITRVLPLDEARDSGARALFGEKYSDEVRVVSMGTQAKGANHAFSVELCGGTHTKKTGDIVRLKITSESALSAGIRRLEAVTGSRADAYEQNKAQASKDAADKLSNENKKLLAELKSLGGSAPASEGDLDKENRKLEKLIADLRRKSATDSADEIKTIGSVKFIGKVLEGFPAKDLKPMADDLKAKLGSGVIALVSTEEGKASLVVAVTSDLTGKISAVDLVKIGAEALGGKGGGGRPDMAQAGGPNAGAANDAVSKIEKALAA